MNFEQNIDEILDDIEAYVDGILSRGNCEPLSGEERWDIKHILLTVHEEEKINRCVHRYSKQTKIPTCVYCGKKEGE